eukprot:COSAG01_NODE_9882_length_2312_cov_2.736557_2_plen_110_part_00
MRFVDYCPYTFHSFRMEEDITIESYSTSLAQARNAHFQLSGGSGSFLFFSDDNKFVIKQINTDEFNTLLRVLPSYQRHMRENPHSMLQHMYHLRVAVITTRTLDWLKLT